jgi:hypothetical protein
MTEKLFREGGPLNVRRTGPDQYTMKITPPADAGGRVGRECPNEECSPGYFKVTPGTGITTGHVEAFCPYCRHAAPPEEFATREQLRFAKDLVMREARNGIDRMVRDAFGLGPSNRRTQGRGGLVSMEISYKPGARHSVRPPLEEQVRRDVVCPHCGLDHSVYGLATWCADCGADVFLTHANAELAVVAKMLGDVDRRRETLGERIAAKDLENCLEDTVSIFEAVLKILVRRALRQRGVASEDLEQTFRGIGAGFQNVDRAAAFLGETFQLADLPGLSSAERDRLAGIFEKRHPITHNLGVIDRKYLEKAAAAVREAREISVNAGEITEALAMARRVFEALAGALLVPASPAPPGA